MATRVRGVKRYDEVKRDDRRHESKGMKEYWDHHHRYPRAHHREDDRQLEDQKVRRNPGGIKSVLLDKRVNSLGCGYEEGRMKSGTAKHNWRDGRNRLNPRGA